MDKESVVSVKSLWRLLNYIVSITDNDHVLIFRGNSRGSSEKSLSLDINYVECEPVTD